MVAARTVLVLHWGRLGAGPLITARMADALAAQPGVRVLASMEVGADARPQDPAVELRLIETYRGRAMLVLRLPHLVRIALQTRRWMRRERVDVYFSPMFSVWQSLALRLMVPRGVLSVHTIHDATQHPGDAHPVLEFCQRLEMSHADVVVGFSEYSAQRLREQVPASTPVIAVPHGTDVAIGVVGRHVPSNPVLGFFGRISEYKGIAEYAEAVRLIVERIPGARGRVIGDGDIDPVIVESTRDIIDWRIGWVDAADVESSVDGFDLVLLPYQEASQSGVLALAASRGVPTVATPVGGLIEQAQLLGGTAMATGTSAGAVADAAIALLGDPDAYKRLSEAGIAASAAETGWNAVAARFLVELDEVAPRGNVAPLTR